MRRRSASATSPMNRREREIFWQNRHPHIVGGAVALAYVLLWSWKRFAIPANYKELISNSITVAAITMGFVATAKSIVATTGDNPFILRVKAHKAYGTFVFLIQEVARFALSLILFGLFGLALPAPPPPTPLVWTIVLWHLGFACWSWLVLATLLAFMRIVKWMGLMLHDTHGQQGPHAKSQPAPPAGPKDDDPVFGDDGDDE